MFRFPKILLGCPKLALSMEDCGVCDSYIETRWATCPLCGDFDSSTIDSNISIVNLVEKSDYIEIKKEKKKKLKSKCCKKYKKQNKSACKSCPKFAVRSDEKIQVRSDEVTHFQFNQF
jgi:hypothetical protein